MALTMTTVTVAEAKEHLAEKPSPIDEYRDAILTLQKTGEAGLITVEKEKDLRGEKLRFKRAANGLNVKIVYALGKTPNSLYVWIASDEEANKPKRQRRKKDESANGTAEVASK